LKPPDAITLFLDRSLGRHVVADRLRQAGAKVEIHDDHFPPDALDQDWLSVVGKKHWVVLTKDKSFQHRDLEITAVARARVRCFS